VFTESAGFQQGRERPFDSYPADAGQGVYNVALAKWLDLSGNPLGDLFRLGFGGIGQQSGLCIQLATGFCQHAYKPMRQMFYRLSRKIFPGASATGLPTPGQPLFKGGGA
jgi:hypothetical protein